MGRCSSEGACGQVQQQKQARKQVLAAGRQTVLFVSLQGYSIVSSWLDGWAMRAMGLLGR